MKQFTEENNMKEIQYVSHTCKNCGKYYKEEENEKKLQLLI